MFLTTFYWVFIRYHLRNSKLCSTVVVHHITSHHVWIILHCYVLPIIVSVSWVAPKLLAAKVLVVLKGERIWIPTLRQDQVAPVLGKYPSDYHEWGQKLEKTNYYLSLYSCVLRKACRKHCSPTWQYYIYNRTNNCNWFLHIR